MELTCFSMGRATGFCDALLVRAGQPRLTAVMADGVQDMEATLNVEDEGVKHEQLDAEKPIDLDQGEAPETLTTALQPLLQILDLFVSRTDGAGENQPQLQPVPFTAGHDDYTRSLAQQALFSGDALGAARHIFGNPYGSQREGLSSVYVDKSGTVYVMRPHGHTVAAFNAIRDNLPEGYEVSRETLPKSGIDFRRLTRLSGGIMRGQFYPHGVGMSVDLQHPPTPAQLRAMADYHALTSQTTFVAELYDGETLVGYARNMAGLRCVLEKVQGGVRSGKLRSAAAECGNVVIGEGLPESVGGRIGG
ncbi:MAG: hypothetical protein ACRYFS_14975 [Janthinobacterium lividum]